MKKLILPALIVLLLAACKKETKIINEVPNPTLSGEWFGLYGANLTSIPNNPYYFLIRPDNTIKISGTDTSTLYVADSSYKVTGDTLRSTYTYRLKNGTSAGTYTIAARFLSNYSFMSGTWGYGSNAYNGGSFFMGRKQK